MKKLILITAINCFLNSSFAQNLAWSDNLNVKYTDYITDIHVDNEGSLLICGQFSSTIDFDPGPDSVIMSTAGNMGSDIYMAKYDYNGNFLWSHRFGTSFFYDEGDRITTDTAGNVFLTGFFNSTVDFDPDSNTVFTLTGGGSSRSRFLAKYNKDGKFIAAKKVGNAVGTQPSSQDAQTGLACDLNGNVYMSGFYGTSLVLGPGVNGTLPVSGLSDNYFAKYDSSLNLIWAHRLGSNGTDFSQGMYVSDTGSIIVLGSFSNTINFDPAHSNFSFNRIGNTQDGYFAEYDSSGNFIFAKQLVPGSSCAPIAVTVDSRKNILITGSAAGTLDANPDTSIIDSIGSGYNDQVFLASYDTSGNYRWAFAFGDVGAYQAGTSLSLDSADNIYLTGFYEPLVDLDPAHDTATLGNLYSGFVAVYDTGGNFKTAFNGFDALVKLKIHNEAIYMTGFYYGLVDFDPGPAIHTMLSDTLNSSWFLLKMDVCDSPAFTPGTILVPAVCSGDTITLHVNQGGPLYEWTFSSGLIPLGNTTSDSVVIVIDNAASDELITCRSIGGCMNSAVVYFNLHNHHPVVPLVIQINDTLHTAANAIAYQWYRNDTVLTGEIDSLYAPDVPGIYSVIITDSNGCSVSSLSTPFTFTGIESLQGITTHIYPNPFTGNFTIEFSTMMKETSITCSDVNGKILMKKLFSGNKLVIESDNFSPGVYFLEWNEGNTARHSRIIKR